jgi:fused signal recognition particle receptor
MFFKRFREGLKNTTRSLTRGIASLFSTEKKSLEEALEHLEQVLIEADLGVNLVMETLESLREKKPKTVENARHTIREILCNQFLSTPRNLLFLGKPQVFLFTGINGSGKTTSIAKIANLLKNQGKSVMLAAGDTFRAAAVEQLSIWAERLKLPIVKHPMGTDPAAVAYDACASARAKGVDAVLMDTAGRIHNQQALMEELKKVTRVLQKQVSPEQIETLLILDGNSGQNAFIQAKIFKETIGIGGLIVTKLDGTAKGGIVVSIERELKIPVKFIGLGETMEDLLPFVPEDFVDALLSENADVLTRE